MASEAGTEGIPRLLGKEKGGAGKYVSGFKCNTGNQRFRNRSCLGRRFWRTRRGRLSFLTRRTDLSTILSGFNFCPLDISSAIARTADRGGGRAREAIRSNSTPFLPSPRFRPRKKQKPGLYKCHRASGCSDDAAVKFRMREIWAILRHVQPKNQPPYHLPLSPASVL